MPTQPQHVADTTAPIDVQALLPGDRAPIFALPTMSGAIVRSDALLAQGPLVVSFSCDVWCPSCHTARRSLQDLLSQIKARGATLVAISPQPPATEYELQRETGISFEILVDMHNHVARRFGLVQGGPVQADLPPSDGPKAPIPARFVIAPDGVVTHAELHIDTTERSEPAKLIGTLDRLADRISA